MSDEHPNPSEKGVDQSPPRLEIKPPEIKPDKNVSAPELDLLTEGYDPAKLKRR
jgi:hypothetical protein